MSNEEDFLLIESIEDNINSKDDIINNNNQNKSNNNNNEAINTTTIANHVTIPKYYSKTLACKDISSYCLITLCIILLYTITIYINYAGVNIPFIIYIISITLCYIPYASIKVYLIIREAYFAQLNLIGKLIIDIVYYSLISLIALLIGVLCFEITNSNYIGTPYISVCLLIIDTMLLLFWLILFIGLRKRKKVAVFISGLLFSLWLSHLIGYLSMNTLSMNEESNWCYYFVFTWLIGHGAIMMIVYSNIMHLLIDISFASSVVLFIIDSEHLIEGQKIISHSKYFALMLFLIIMMKMTYDKSSNLFQSPSSMEWKQADID